MPCRNFKFPRPCSSGLRLDEKEFCRLLFIIATINIHIIILGLSEVIATSSLKDAGAHFLTFLFLTYDKRKRFFSFPSPLSIWFSMKSWQSSRSLPVFLTMRSCLGKGEGISFFSSTFEGRQGDTSFPFKNDVVQLLFSRHQTNLNPKI